MAEEKQKQKKQGQKGDQTVEEHQDLEQEGDAIDERLDDLDELIDEALGEEESAQRFVDNFKQEGGQ
jgi:hypothetical protein